MKTLPLERIWTGDSQGANPVTHRQVKRTDRVAMYSCHHKNVEKPIGYEVFLVNKRLKGQPLPGGVFEEEDREVYPSANSFGKIAWYCSTLESAEKRFNELTNNTPVVVEKDIEQEVETVPVVVVEGKRGRGRPKKEVPAVKFPDKEFTMQDILDINVINRSTLYFIIQDFIQEGVVDVVRREVRGKGKPTVIYKKN